MKYENKRNKGREGEKKREKKKKHVSEPGAVGNNDYLSTREVGAG